MIKNDIKSAVEVLRKGGLVAVPTETVYGLGADASNPAAIRQIFIAKQRPQDHPLIVHIADMNQMTDWAREIPQAAIKLASHFWPGPMTLILKKAPHVSDLITGGQDTVGLRIPRHPVAQALLQAFGGGIAAPSANRFGRISPTTAAAVYEELGDAVDMILEGGQCEVGLESTIIDVSGDAISILRPGMITAGQVEDVLQQPVLAQQRNAPRVSGSLESHYAPLTKTVIMTKEEIESLQNSKNIGVVKVDTDPVQYAHNLYQTLRDLDKQNLDLIIIESIPEDSAWDAIRKRINRAATVRERH